MTANDRAASESTAPDETMRLGLHRAVAVLKPDSIAVRPARAGWLGPLVQAFLAGGAVWLIATFINTLELWALAVLLLVAMISGPLAVLGLVYNVAGARFIMERGKGTARWQQGFLGLGLGTHELVPFARIRRVEVASDGEQRLSSGDRQDVIRWVVRLVKDNDREIEIGSVMAARPLAHQGAERANTLAAAVATMANAAVRLTPVPDEPDRPAAPATAAPGATVGEERERRRYRRRRTRERGGR
ncbi:MAG: hypothetical protein WEB13_12060 [Dehalococcoidia bacterium]